MEGDTKQTTHRLAILGGTPARTEPYPAWPVFDERDLEAVAAVIRSGQWGGYPYPGPQTAEFARRFVALQAGGDASVTAVPMANGTVTMEVALRAAGVGWGDEVIVPAYTFHATAGAPIAAGAIPILVDIDPETYCIDPKAIEAAITPQTRAMIPVHLGAQMADMDAIMVIAERYHLIVIEDCAHAHGAQWRSRGAGTIGHFGSFSLQSSKILTTGEGGVLLCQTPELAARAASLIDCGRPHDSEQKIYTLGANYRMTELQAALGNVAIERFPEQARQRQEMAAYMDEALSEIPGVRLLKRDPRHTRRSFYRYIFAIQPEIFGLENQIVCAALEAEGIPCEVGYDGMHRNKEFQPWLSKLPVPSAFPEKFEYTGMSFPITESASEHEAVWLDECIFRAGKQGVDDVVAALRKIQEHAAELAQAGANRWAAGELVARKGPPVVLLHGFPEFWRGWVKQIEPLAQAGYRVVVPDQRGYNLSDKPKGVASYRVETLAADVVGLIDAAGREKAFLVGHDWGAAVAWGVALTFPERVKKLGILNVPHPAVMQRALLSSWRQARKSWYIFFFQIPGFPEWALSLNQCAGLRRMMKASRKTGTFNETDLDEYVKAWSQPGALTSMVNWYRAAFRNGVRSSWNPNQVGVARVTVPTLMLWGKQDIALSYEMAQPSIDLCDEGRLVFFENASHWVQHDEAEQVNKELLEFFR